MSQGSWGSGPGGGGGGNWGGGGEGYGPPPGYTPQQQGNFAPPPPGYPPGYTPPRGAAVAWEDESLGLFSRWWTTVTGVCFDARAFHGASAASDNPLPAWIFALVSAAIGGLGMGIFLCLIYVIFGGISAAAMKSTGGPAAPMAAILAVSGVVQLVAQPLMRTFLAGWMPWVQAGVLHGALMILKGTTRPYTSTVRVVAYSWAADAWLLVPVLGAFIGPIFQLISIIIGLDETHKCGGGKAAAAVFLPLVLVCGCCCLFYFGIAAMGFAAGAAGHHP